MPYISKNRRDALFSLSKTDFDNRLLTKGELNFMITELMVDYVTTHGVSYTTLSNASGAARDAANEFDRIVLSKYEDMQKKENGDVYSPIYKLMNNKKKGGSTK
jgi:hypothetical protein